MGGPQLSISEVSRTTGISVATLRAWERRFDFPVPERTASGHRRYDEAICDLLHEVVVQRDGGMSLEVAIAGVREAGRGTPSIYASLRRNVSDARPVTLSKPSLLRISRAIEDEYLARGEPASLFAFFQRERFYRASEDRWRELARTASSAVVFAEFDAPRSGRDPVEVPLAGDDVMRREWAIVCDGPAFSASVAGWERPSPPGGDAHRRFECVWTTERRAVRLAAAVCCTITARSLPELAHRVRQRLRGLPPPAGPEARDALALTSRLLATGDGRDR